MPVPKNVQAAADAAEKAMKANMEAGEGAVDIATGDRPATETVERPPVIEPEKPEVIKPEEHDKDKPPETTEQRFKFQDYLDGLDGIRDNPTELYDRVNRLGEAHKVLHGKYRNEVPRYAEQVRSLETENQALKSQVAALTSKVNTGDSPTGDVKKPATDGAIDAGDDIDLKAYGYTDEQIEDFGEDILRQQVRVQKKMIDQTVQPLHQQLRQTQAESFEGRVKSLVPNVDQINYDPDFHAFLDKPISPYVSTTLKDVLQDAVSRGDVDGTARIFKEFSGDGNVQARKPNTPRKPDEQVVPSSSGGAPAPSDAQAGKVYTGAEYSALVNRIIRGEVKGETAKALKLELDAAIKQGRIR